MKNRSKTRKGVLKFNPTRDYIEQATSEYFANGGQITFLSYKKESEYSVFINDTHSVSRESDEFLLGS